MERYYRKKMIQQGFDTVAVGYDSSLLSFFLETAKRLVEHLSVSKSIESDPIDFVIHGDKKEMDVL